MSLSQSKVKYIVCSTFSFVSTFVGATAVVVAIVFSDFYWNSSEYANRLVGLSFFINQQMG